MRSTKICFLPVLNALKNSQCVGRFRRNYTFISRNANKRGCARCPRAQQQQSIANTHTLFLLLPLQVGCRSICDCLEIIKPSRKGDVKFYFNITDWDDFAFTYGELDYGKVAVPGFISFLGVVVCRIKGIWMAISKWNFSKICMHIGYFHHQCKSTHILLPAALLLPRHSVNAITCICLDASGVSNQTLLVFGAPCKKIT